MIKRQNVFPLIDDTLAMSLESHPVYLDGMKLLFDKKVALYPVNLEKSVKQIKTKKNGK